MTKELLKKIRSEFDSFLDIDDTQAFKIIVRAVFQHPEAKYLTDEERDHLIKTLFYKTRKPLGILDELIEDKEISEIMVNGPNHIFIEKHGKVKRYPWSFESVEELEEIIRKIVGAVHREINELNPIVDARLPNGSRVNCVYKNIAVNGPILTIRKFLSDYMKLEELCQNYTMTEEVAAALRIFVLCGYNIFVSGGTSSGKTTLLNALAEAIPIEERVIVVEDSMELKMKNIENIVHMECRRSNALGKGAITMKDLLKTSLRMRPDRIIVGEVRGEEVVSMLDGMNTGHAGSLSTGHGNSIEGMLKRLETMYLMALPLDLDGIRGQIAQGIDLMIHMEKTARGRRITEICELTGYINGEYELNYLYKINENGRISPTGNLVKNQRKVKLKGADYVNQLRQLQLI